MTQSIWSVHGRAYPNKIKETECLPALTVFHLVLAIPSHIKMPLFLFKQASFVKVFFVAFIGIVDVSMQFSQNTPCCQDRESRCGADKKTISGKNQFRDILVKVRKCAKDPMRAMMHLICCIYPFIMIKNHRSDTNETETYAAGPRLQPLVF